MKSIVLGALLALSTVANAEVRTEVRDVTMLSYDGMNLSASYYTGGGCQPHKGDIELKLDKKTNTVYVTVVDVTPQEDYCQALVPGQVFVNLHLMVKELLQKSGVNADVWSVNVVLPSVSVRPWQ